MNWASMILDLKEDRMVLEPIPGERYEDYFKRQVEQWDKEIQEKLTQVERLDVADTGSKDAD